MRLISLVDEHFFPLGFFYHGLSSIKCMDRKRWKIYQNGILPRAEHSSTAAPPQAGVVLLK